MSDQELDRYRKWGLIFAVLGFFSVFLSLFIPDIFDKTLVGSDSMCALFAFGCLSIVGGLASAAS